MNTILIILIILLLIYTIFYNKDQFNVQTGVKKGFSNVYSPYPPCLYKNDCFPGYYFRTESYNSCY